MYMHMHMHVLITYMHMHVLITKYNLFSPYNIICDIYNIIYIHNIAHTQFSELTGTGQPIGMLLHREDHLCQSQLYLVANSSLCRVEDGWTFPIHLDMPIDIILVQFRFGQ